jgi:hypothetical protein
MMRRHVGRFLDHGVGNAPFAHCGLPALRSDFRIDALTPRNYGVPPEQRTVILGDNISTQSIRSTLKPAYGLILRERRRYFRCPISIPVTILR